MALGSNKQKLVIEGENKTKRAFGRVMQSMRSLGQQAKQIGRTLGIAFGVAGGALSVLVNKTLEAQDRIGKLAQQVGVSTEALSEMQFAAEQTGASGETLAAGLEVMSKRLGEVAIKGSGAAAPAIEKLGLSVHDLVKMKPDEQFMAIAEAMGGLSNQSERNAVTANIFSRANQSLVNTLALGGKGMDEMREKARELGRSLSQDQTDKAAEANDAMNELKSALTGVANELTTKLAPAITQIARALTRTLPDAIDTTIGWYERLRTETKDTFDFVLKIVEGWAYGISLMPGAMGRAAKETLIELMKFRSAFEDTELDRSIQMMVDRNQDLFKSFKAGGPVMLDTINVMGDMGGAAGEVSDETKNAAKEFDKFADAIQDRFPMMGGRLESLADTMRSIGVETKATAMGIGKALGDALGDMKAKMEQHKADQRRIWDNLIDGVQGAWVGFFENVFQGKGLDSIKDFLSTVKDLFFRLIAEIAARWTAAKIFGGSFSLGSISIGGGGGVAGIGQSIAAGVSKLFGGGASGISGASVVGTAPAATGAASGFGGLGALGTAGAGAAILAAQTMIIKSIRGASSRDLALKDLQRAGPAVAGGLGLSATAGDKFGFGLGANAGFAAEFAKGQIGNRAGTAGDGLAVFKGMDLEGTVQLLDEAQEKFEALKRSAASTFSLGRQGAMRVGRALQDGFIDKVELADMGFIALGERIENTKSGVVKMGELSIEQFEAVMGAVDKNILRLEALRGETNLNAREMQFLGEQGLTAAGQVQAGFEIAGGAIRSFGQQSAAALLEIEGAARAAGGAVAGIGGEGPAGAASRDNEVVTAVNNQTREIRRQNQANRFTERGGGGL